MQLGKTKLYYRIGCSPEECCDGYGKNSLESTRMFHFDLKSAPEGMITALLLSCRYALLCHTGSQDKDFYCFLPVHQLRNPFYFV